MYEITFGWQVQGKRLSKTITFESTKLPGTIKIGRDPGQCDIIVNDANNHVSRFHAEITFDQDSDIFYLQNATLEKPQPNTLFLNSDVVTGKVKIKEGDIIVLRDVPLTVESIQVQIKTQANQTQVNQAAYHQNQNQNQNKVKIPQQGQNNSYNLQTIQLEAQNQVKQQGEITLGQSILQSAAKNDFGAISVMFKQFVPEDEQIEYACYLGIRGLWGIGTRQFACVTNRRVADITVGLFGEVTYQDGFLEHINSGIIYQPSKLWLYVTLLGYFLFGVSFVSPIWTAILSILNFFSLGLVTPLILVFNIASVALFVPWVIRWYYRIVKSGLVMTVTEGQIYLSPMGGYAFSHRLIYFFSNRKLIARASSLYRNFIIQREIRLNAVKTYPL
ncbi:tetratricopeptide TPR_2 [Calothrix sp. NIES-4071]|nr:tetratricopeptide TPR_2 [Calothrix sp. NIES-4071]BAZ55353.1 tetratricopeptide TPR_2 [Calothrix sp. NIES-4105]